MDLTRAAITVAVAICTVTTVYGQTTQEDLNNIANNLEVKVILRTNHFSFGKHGVQFYLKNNGDPRILHTQDWLVRFSLKNKLFQDETRYTKYGLEIVPEKGCHYLLKPDPTSNPAFEGLGANDTRAFTVPASGLSVFRTDVYPRFIVYAGSGLSARTIRSTASDSLNFVYIHSDNVSVSDPSLMTGIRRHIVQANIFDQGGVPASTVVPAPVNVTISTQPPPQIVRLENSRWYIWADRGISETFKTRLRDSLTSLPNMTNRVQIFQPTGGNRRPPADASIIYLLKRNKPGTSKDYYQLAINSNRTDFIHITAGTEEGFANALSSLKSITGLFTVVPHITITDDARFGHRSVMLDLTKNFFGADTILKFINLMSMYKLNNLVLNLADNYGWRLQMPDPMDFSELISVGSRRCFDEHECLLPSFGSGADDSTSGSGFYTIQQFQRILVEAERARITVTPRINFMGSLLSAKKASHKRYMRLKNSNQAEADRLHIMSSNYPTISEAERSDDTCYTNGVLDPCNSPTENFIRDVIDAISDMYHIANIPLKEFHAGGDETTEYMHKFQGCNDPLRKMLKTIQGALRPYTTLRVSEEAVSDRDTGSCLAAAQNYAPNTIIVDFWNIVPSDHSTWGLTPDQLAYLNSPVTPIVNETGTDPVKPVNFTRKGDAPWSKAYKCANMDYKVILAPEPFFSLDSAYELDFNEIGNRKRDRFYVISLHRLFVFEPFNYYTNMDLTTDRYRVLPYRLCKIFNCVKVRDDKKHNIIGMQATIDTSVIRTEKTLWHMTLPRLLGFAEKVWREGAFENILDPTDPTTLTNMTVVSYRASALDFEINRFLNNYGYKESGRMDAAGYTYRVARPATSIYFGVTFRTPGPYPVVVKVETPGVDVDYRERYGADRSWKPLFRRDPVTEAIVGGYNFSFPFNPTRPRGIDIRVLSTDGQRASIPTALDANTDNLWPRDIPEDLRRGTCLPIYEPWATRLEDVTPAQWSRILVNIPLAHQDNMLFQQNRALELQNTFLRHRQQYPLGSRYNPVPANITVGEVFMQIETLFMNEVNITSRESPDIYKDMFEKAQEIDTRREQQLLARMEGMHREYLSCPGVTATGTNPAGGSAMSATGTGSAGGTSGNTGFTG